MFLSLLILTPLGGEGVYLHFDIALIPGQNFIIRIKTHNLNGYKRWWVDIKNRNY